MDAVLKAAADPTDLLNVSDAATPYRFDRIFRGEGFGAKRLGRRRLKLLQEIDPEVRKLLASGEKVGFVSWGIDYSFAEHWFMGIWAQLISRRALIFTDRRLLLVQINSRRKVMDLKSQLRFEGIDKLKRGSFGGIGLVLRDGKKLHLTSVPRRDRKQVRALLQAGIDATRSAAPGLGRENLCPHCGHRVLGFPAQCSRCARGFKSGARAAWLSLAFPGLGDLYLGHRMLGAVEILGALVAWAVVLGPVVLGAGEESLALDQAALLGCLFFVFGHGTDSWITRRVGFKGLYPER